MNREDIIRMAREVGFEVLLPSEEIFGRGGVYTGSDDEISEYLERFAALVASAEREACAKIAHEYVGQDLEHNFSAVIAHNIRARGSHD